MCVVKIEPGSAPETVKLMISEGEVIEISDNLVMDSSNEI